MKWIAIYHARYNVNQSPVIEADTPEAAQEQVTAWLNGLVGIPKKRGEWIDVGTMFNTTRSYKQVIGDNYHVDLMEV